MPILRDGLAWQLLLIEAKGAMPWNNKQLKSKAARLEQIFGSDGKRWPSIKPHFFLASRSEPTERLDCSDWPAWMKRQDGRPTWVKFMLPQHSIRITRCDESGRIMQQGNVLEGFAAALEG